MALLLIGQTDANGRPTATRTLITATTARNRNCLAWAAWSIRRHCRPPHPLFTPIPATIDPLAELDVQVIAVTYGGGQITARLRLYNGGNQTAHLTPDDLQLALGYAPEPPGPQLPADGLTRSICCRDKPLI